jgi:A/G-specific adenine glycosylase
MQTIDSQIFAKQFAEKIMSWYYPNKRDLPWRNIQDPYKIWLSEIILQQTRVQQGMPYYYKFVENYPTVKDLANAPEQEVLRLWQGLGYYSRARNLHFAAKQVCNEWNGEFPNSFEKLLKLKGVGRYTAAAIASFAFKEKVAVVDGNVYRVLARVFGIEEDISSPKGQKVFEKLANELISFESPDIYNQAIMEFGAIHCKPANPDCMFCTFRLNCVAFNSGRVDTLPVKGKSIQKKTRFFNYLVIEWQDSFLLSERLKKDIWQGLFDFPCVELSQETEFEDILKELLPLELHQNIQFVKISDEYKHILTHQLLKVRFYHLKIIAEREKIIELSNHLKSNIYDIDAIKNLPKPILIHQYLTEFLYV